MASSEVLNTLYLNQVKTDRLELMAVNEYLNSQLATSRTNMQELLELLIFAWGKVEYISPDATAEVKLAERINEIVQGHTL